METKIKKPIKNVSINFADGTHENLEEYVLAGHDSDTWYKVMYSPALDEEKIHLNTWWWTFPTTCAKQSKPERSRLAVYYQG